MKNVRLEQIEIKNFKGIKSFKGDLGVDVTSILGANGSGKTTLVDAFVWTLFGKDSQDNKVFSIKPLNADNSVKHNLESSVKIVLNVDSIEYSFERIYKEQWTKQRGTGEVSLTGHNTELLVDNVPLKVKDYNQNIENIIDEELFKLLTSPIVFPSLHWKKQREQLVDIVGEIDVPKSAFVTELVNSGILEDKLMSLVATRKKLEKELDELPIRIDQTEANTPLPLDWKNLEDKIEVLEKEIAEIDLDIADESAKVAKVNDYYINWSNDVATLKVELSNKVREADVLANDKTKVANKEAIEVNQFNANVDLQISKLKGDILRSEGRVQFINNTISGINKELVVLREDYSAVYAGEFNPDNNVCDCCGQALPESEIKSLELYFNEKKDSSIQTINKKGKGLNVEITILEAEILGLKKSIFNVNEVISEMEASKKTPIENIAQFESVDTAKIIELRKSIVEMENNKPVRVGVENDYSALRGQKNNAIMEIKIDLKLQDRIEADKNTVAELQAEMQEKAQKIADLELKEDDINSYITQKIEVLEARVNAMFKNISFKMFKEQLNGGMKDTCEILINGVPYSDANSAGKTNAGLEVINVLSDYYKVSAPIFIDNKESVTKVITTSGQQIHLIVDANYKQLTIK